MPNNTFTINQRALRGFIEGLGDRLHDAVAGPGVEAVRDNTPVWSQRLHNSTRAGEVAIRQGGVPIDGNAIECPIIAGGTVEMGILQEQGIFRETDYAYEVEIRTGYIRSNIGEIADAIVDGLKP